MTLRFDQPGVLYLLWLAPAFAGWCSYRLRARQSELSRFISPAMAARLAPPASDRGTLAQVILISAGILLSLIALARPQWGQRDETILARGRDVAILLDVSRSMLADDVRPNRLNRAKTDILDLLQALKGDRAALIAFRHNAVVLSPLTTDYGYLRSILEGVDTDSAQRGETDIGQGIETAMNVFEKEGGSHRTIVLISDGEDLSGRALEAATAAKAAGIPVYTVGFGRDQGTQIPNREGGFITHDGANVVTRLDHGTLEAIARNTGGAYIPVGTASMTTSNLGTIYRDYLAELGAHEYAESVRRRFIDRFQYFLAPALLCFLAAAFLSNGRPAPASAPLAARGTTVALLLCLSLLPRPASATESISAIDLARQAQTAFRAEQFNEAADLYRRAADATANAELREDFRHNEAVALHRARRFAEAADRFASVDESATANPADAARHLGLALFDQAHNAAVTNAAAAKTKAALFKKSADAFRSAFHANGADAAALDNLRIATAGANDAEAEARRALIQERYGNKQAPDLTASLLALQRDVVIASQQASTNPSPTRIDQLETAADKQQEAAEAFRLLQAALAGAQGSDAAAWQSHAAAIENSMQSAAESLRDMDDRGIQQAALAEHAIYPLWKAIADYRSILREDLRQQENVLGTLTNSHPVTATTVSNQIEALQLTRLFKDRFLAQTETTPETATQPGMPSTPPIEPETRQRILTLCDQATNSQAFAASTLAGSQLPKSLVHSQQAQAVLKEIESLLPKDDNSSPQQQPQQNKEQQEDAEEQEPESDPKENPDNHEEAPPEESKEESPPEENEAQEQEPQTAEDVRQALDKALQRERDHEATLRERQRQADVSPAGRDW